MMRDRRLIRRSATCDVLYITATCRHDLFIMLLAHGGEVCCFTYFPSQEQ